MSEKDSRGFEALYDQWTELAATLRKIKKDVAPLEPCPPSVPKLLEQMAGFCLESVEAIKAQVALHLMEATNSTEGSTPKRRRECIEKLEVLGFAMNSEGRAILQEAQFLIADHEKDEDPSPQGDVTLLNQYRDRCNEYAKRYEEIESAVRWALGENGAFATRQEGQGAYWWRSELRQRAFGINRDTRSIEAPRAHQKRPQM